MNTPDKPIWVCLATKNNLTGVQQCLLSLQTQVQKHSSGPVHLLLLDKSSNRQLKRWLKDFTFPGRLRYYDMEGIRVLERQHRRLFQALNYDLAQDSIQLARIQLMLAIHAQWEELQDAILWQVDDDVLFQELLFQNDQLIKNDERDFFAELKMYHATYPEVDAAIGMTTFAPPIPILLYAQTQLMDILYRSQGSDNMNRFQAGQNYHDLYGLAKGAIGTTLPSNQPTEKLINGFLRGIPITRPILRGNEHVLALPPAPTLLRGANFVIFTPELVLSMPHLAFSYAQIIGRRSDMIHAWMVAEVGYTLRSIDLSLIHNRNFPAINLPKIKREYLADLIGAVAFRYLSQGKEQAKHRFELHHDHLTQLKDTVDKCHKKFAFPMLQALSQEVLQLEDFISSWHWEKFEISLKEFEKFAHSWLKIGIRSYL